jgi:hypothetical protein
MLIEGKKQIEVVWAVLKLKELFPKNIFLLRGNHEDLAIAQEPDHGFYYRVK